MQADIEFRAWYKNTEMLDWDALLASENTLQDLFDNSDYILMQYIGLKDKNGRKVFSGDIFESKNLWDKKPKMLRGFIDWGDYGHQTCHTAYGWFMNTAQSEELLGWQQPSISDVEGLEVLGNIYENPELVIV